MRAQSIKNARRALLGVVLTVGGAVAAPHFLERAGEHYGKSFDQLGSEEGRAENRAGNQDMVAAIVLGGLAVEGPILYIYAAGSEITHAQRERELQLAREQAAEVYGQYVLALVGPESTMAST